MDYRYKVEFEQDEYDEIDRYCKELGIQWFVSCWDHKSVEFMEQYEPPCYKLASASMTDDALLKVHRDTGRPLIMSTGMSSMEQIEHAVNTVGTDNLMLMHTTSSYPCPPEDINLRMIHTLKEKFGVPVGYSGHETGLPQSVAAVAMGACSVERHFTLDRSMWGSDQGASLEPTGMRRLVRYIRTIETSLGDGVKKVTPTEEKMAAKLRRR